MGECGWVCASEWVSGWVGGLVSLYTHSIYGHSNGWTWPINPPTMPMLRVTADDHDSSPPCHVVKSGCYTSVSFNTNQNHQQWYPPYNWRASRRYSSTLTMMTRRDCGSVQYIGSIQEQGEQSVFVYDGWDLAHSFSLELARMTWATCYLSKPCCWIRP